MVLHARHGIRIIRHNNPAKKNYGSHLYHLFFQSIANSAEQSSFMARVLLGAHRAGMAWPAYLQVSAFWPQGSKIDPLATFWLLKKDRQT